MHSTWDNLLAWTWSPSQESHRAAPEVKELNPWLTFISLQLQKWQDCLQPGWWGSIRASAFQLVEQTGKFSLEIL